MFRQDEAVGAATWVQPEVSRLERRRDVKLSVARAYVEALGGELVVLARFGRESVELDQAGSTAPVPRAPRPL